MFSRIRSAVSLALLLALVTSVTVFAKGGFTFISITGPGIDEEVRAADSKLTEDFFAFADFYRDKVEAPVEPGQGYEIKRYYVDGKREIAFDQLHYYPETGFVFYDGIINGESEYDGEWYSANPNVKSAFESVLPAPFMAKPQPAQAEPAREAQPAASINQSRPVTPTVPFNSVIPVAALAGLLVLLALALKLRKPVVQSPDQSSDGGGYG